MYYLICEFVWFAIVELFVIVELLDTTFWLFVIIWLLEFVFWLL